ncbi:MAG TPA: FecR domain-containing protein [Polyangiaceae bacterium]|nr:FecR domain-containing protein [Polyangiaceae bacterium]
MTEKRSKLERAVGAMRDEVWDDLRHRRVAKRLDEALEEPERAKRWWLAGVGAAALATAIVALVLVRPWAEPTPSVAGHRQPESARTVLADGSTVDVQRGGQIQVLTDRSEGTRIEVLAGRAEFEVQKRVARPFVASVRGVEVRVIGTHFSTELDESHPPGVVRVVVSRGVVEVVGRQGERVARLQAGDRIEVSLAPAAKEPLPASSSPGDVDAVVPGEPGASAVRAASPPDAAQLFEAASAARRAGDVQAAVKAYAALLKQFPHDSRVGVAALELGRLRMDSQHAYGAASDAFRRAIAAAPNEGVREDAMARLVESVDALGDKTACLTEQQRYQARYPTGVHAAAVRGRCGAR